ncbi:hypothetical protein HYT56_01975 [Candidatus Woesearchaeota archaeon]|nr:hypothetical protein [Candidatus Woesearchaeota archaeon]
MNEFFNGFRKGMKNFGENISIIVNSVLLLIVYIIGVGLTSIVAKIFRKRFLDLRFRKDSYWTDLGLKKKEMKAYFRRF